MFENIICMKLIPIKHNEQVVIVFTTRSVSKEETTSSPLLCYQYITNYTVMFFSKQQQEKMLLKKWTLSHKQNVCKCHYDNDFKIGNKTTLANTFSYKLFGLDCTWCR